MTAANEKPTCPCCGSGSINRWPNEMYEYDCNDCGCGWDESKRRAQTADRPPEGYVMIAEKALRALSPELFRELQDYCRYPLTKAQTADGVDQKAIAESAWEAGYISAQQDERYPPAPPLPDHVFEMIMANARSGTVDEDKEFEAFTEWLFKQPATRIDPFVAWLARARSGK